MPIALGEECVGKKPKKHGLSTCKLVRQVHYLILT
jgi:hypothetical protein